MGKNELELLISSEEYEFIKEHPRLIGNIKDSLLKRIEDRQNEIINIYFFRYDECSIFPTEKEMRDCQKHLIEDGIINSLTEAIVYMEKMSYTK